MAEHANGPGASGAAATEGHIKPEANAADTSTAQTQGKLHSALQYAALGWRILPCEPGGKRAILKDWPARASTDPATVRRWWRRAPNANIAVATGIASNLLVLDIDGEEGEVSLIKLERLHGQRLPHCYPMQLTGSGRGWQGFFKYPPGRLLGNTASTLGPGIDTRGNGGYALIPPSLTAQPYRWADDRAPADLPPELPPGWLVDLLDPAPVPKPKREVHIELEDRYLFRALVKEFDAVATAAEGQRNHRLNNAAMSLFRFAEDDQLDVSTIVDGLEDAARAAGLTDTEIRRTIASAARARGISL